MMATENVKVIVDGGEEERDDEGKRYDEVEVETKTAEEEGKKKGKIPWKVYLAHILATWGDNLWLFAGGLYMVHLDPSSLRLTAAYGLVIAATVIALGAAVGRWIDRTQRLTAARTCLLTQNTSVSVCAALLCCYLAFRGDLDAVSPSVYVAVVAAAVALSAAAALASAGTVIVLQKDWVVVIAGQDGDKLAKMNSTLRSIELTTFMLAPALVGQLFSLIGYVWTAVFIAGWNIASVIVEYALLSNIYRSYPALHHKIALMAKPEKSDEEAVAVEKDELMGGKAAADGEDNEEPKKGSINKNNRFAKAAKGFYEGWLVYFSHPVRNAGLGLALLYMTVLGFDNITMAYVLSQGVSESVLGVLVAVSAGVGIAGSRAYPIIRKHLGLERTGLLGMMLLVGCSSLAVASVFCPGSPFLSNDDKTMTNKMKNMTSVCVLLAGITAARFGLWVADLTVTQIIQENVEEEKRGVFNGVQSSLNNSLELIKCVLVILLPHQSQFGILIFLSFSAITTGWILYASYSRSRRGHLLPFHNFCRLVHHFDQDGKVDGLVHVMPQ